MGKLAPSLVAMWLGWPKLPPPWQRCIKGKRLGCLCSFHRKLEGVADGLGELTLP